MADRHRPLAQSEPCAALLLMLAERLWNLRDLEAPAFNDSPDAVHQARVEVRRIRSLLKAFGPVLDDEVSAALIVELKWAGVVLGVPRDAEVAIADLGSLVRGLPSGEVVGPVLERLDSALTHRHAEAMTRLRQAMLSRRWPGIQMGFTELLRLPTNRCEAGTGTLNRLAADIDEKVALRLSRALEQPGEWELWHVVRKAAKEAYYVHDALVSFGIQPAKVERRWRRVTRALGRVQDTVVLAEVLAEVEAQAVLAGEPTDTYQLLHEQLMQRRDRELTKGRTRLRKALHGGH